MLTFSLSPDPAVPWYGVFYLAGFGVAGALLLQARARLGVPWRPWLLLIAGTVLALVLGTRLGAGATGGRSVLTGLLVAVPVLAGLRRLLGLNRHAADAFAGPLLLGLAVQNVGCLLAGCCFGHVAGWGVCYGPDTAVFNWQVVAGCWRRSPTTARPWCRCRRCRSAGICW